MPTHAVEPVEDNYLLDHVGEIVSAFVATNTLSQGDLLKLIFEAHRALRSLSSTVPASEDEVLKPAVSIKKSITPEFIICLDDGKKYRSLKRHLTSLGMTPDEYRKKWGLPKDYPMVAPNYSAARSSLAKTSGLGRKMEVGAKSPSSRTKIKR